MMKKHFSILLFTFFLVSGYLILNRNELYSLAQRKLVPFEIIKYKQEMWNNYYQYRSIRIFEKGYNELLRPELSKKVLIYPENEPLHNGSLYLSSGFPERIVKFILPKGFVDGVLRIDSKSESAFSIGISHDLKSWDFSDHHGYSEQLVNFVKIEKKGLFEALYLKFLSQRNKSLAVEFQEFQYLSDLPNKVVGYNSYTLFGKDLDIDYEGKVINQPVVLYEDYKSKKYTPR